MGTLSHAGVDVATFDDRTLAHLQLAIGAKLRRKESFFFGWAVAPEAGTGRVTVWIDPSVPIRFTFDGDELPAINRKWIERITDTSFGPQGMRVVPEPDGT